MGEEIGRCPACNKIIFAEHPFSWCSDCGKMLPAELKARLIVSLNSEPPEAPQPPRPLSWRRAMLHAFMVVAGYFGIGILMAFFRFFYYPEKAGALCVIFCIPAFFLGLGLSYGLQRKNKSLKLIVGGLLLVLLIIQVVMLLIVSHFQKLNRPLTKDEKIRPLITLNENGMVMCHNTLEFQIPLGTIDLSPAPDIDEFFASQSKNLNVVFWSFREANSDKMIIIMACRGISRESDMEKFVQGINKKMVENPQFKLESQKKEWKDNTGSIIISGIILTTQKKVDMRCVSNATGLLVAVQTISNDFSRFDTLRAGLSLKSCN